MLRNINLLIIKLIITVKLRHSVHFTYPLPILRSVNPDSIITNLHIFLSLSYAFLLAASWWLADFCRYFPLPWKSQNIRMHCQKCRTYGPKKSGKFCVLKRILRDTETEGFKTHKSGTVPEKPWQMASLAAEKWEGYKYSLSTCREILIYK
jgi:hypothetical protein